MKKNTTPTVDAVGEMNFEGNVIPHSWYQHIKLPVGKRGLKRKEGKQMPKADHVAIILLSDIIYWYRPTIDREELTGAIVSISKKFFENMLQKQYESWGELFGFTKRQTRDAVSRLVKAGLIKREFRSITAKSGVRLNNVMFVEPIIEEIHRITFTHQETRTIIEKLPPYDVQTSEVSRLNVAPTAFKRQTNTETTTETTTENHHDGDFEKNEKDKQTHPVRESFSNPGVLEKNGNLPLGKYMNAVEAKLSAWSCTFGLSSLESPNVAEMWKAGVPLDLLLQTIDTVVQNSKRKIKSFNFFKDPIWEAFDATSQKQTDRTVEYDATKRLIERLR